MKMKANKNNFFRVVSWTILWGSIISATLSCSSTCIDQWATCYNACPSQEEADQAVQDCLEDCRARFPNDVQAWSECAIGCYNRSREACVDRCGDALHRCLAEE